jgi:hypothetical protein
VALDVGLADSEGGRLRSSPQVAFRDDGYYWFLYPLIEGLRKSHGKYIDLYGEAEFRRSELSLLTRFLGDAEVLIQSQPARWKVHVGTQTGTEKRELPVEVERGKFMSLILQLRDVVAAAEADGTSVLFIGD